MSEDAKKKGFPFKIDEVAGESPDQKVTASYLIKYAKEKGIPAAKESPESIILKGSRGSYSGDDVIDLSQDYVFTIGRKETKGPYRFTVNNQGLESEQPELTAQAILDIARAAGVDMAPNPKLKVVRGRTFEPNELVDLTEFHEFLTPSGDRGTVA